MHGGSGEGQAGTVEDILLLCEVSSSCRSFLSISLSLQRQSILLGPACLYSGVAGQSSIVASNCTPRFPIVLLAVAPFILLKSFW